MSTYCTVIFTKSVQHMSSWTSFNTSNIECSVISSISNADLILSDLARERILSWVARESFFVFQTHFCSVFCFTTYIFSGKEIIVSATLLMQIAGHPVNSRNTDGASLAMGRGAIKSDSTLPKIGGMDLTSIFSTTFLAAATRSLSLAATRRLFSLDMVIPLLVYTKIVGLVPATYRHRQALRLAHLR